MCVVFLVFLWYTHLFLWQLEGVQNWVGFENLGCQVLGWVSVTRDSNIQFAEAFKLSGLCFSRWDDLTLIWPKTWGSIYFNCDIVSRQNGEQYPASHHWLVPCLMGFSSWRDLRLSFSGLLLRFWAKFRQTGIINITFFRRRVSDTFKRRDFKMASGKYIYISVNIYNFLLYFGAIIIIK